MGASVGRLLLVDVGQDFDVGTNLRRPRMHVFVLSVRCLWLVGQRVHNLWLNYCLAFALTPIEANWRGIWR